MSVIMMMRVKGDPSALEQWATENQERIKKIARSGQDAGCVHHMFAASDDGEVVVIDEWPDEASFKRFFDGQPDIPQVMQAGHVTGKPEITFFRKMSMPDEF